MTMEEHRPKAIETTIIRCERDLSNRTRAAARKASKGSALYRNMTLPTECQHPLMGATDTSAASTTTTSTTTSTTTRGFSKQVYSKIDSGGYWQTNTRRWPKESTGTSSYRCKTFSMALIIMVSLFLILLPISSLFPASSQYKSSSPPVGSSGPSNLEAASPSAQSFQLVGEPSKTGATNHLSKRTLFVVGEKIRQDSEYHHEANETGDSMASVVDLNNNNNNHNNNYENDDYITRQQQENNNNTDNNKSAWSRWSDWSNWSTCERNSKVCIPWIATSNRKCLSTGGCHDESLIDPSSLYKLDPASEVIPIFQETKYRLCPTPTNCTDEDRDLRAQQCSHYDSIMYDDGHFHRWRPVLPEEDSQDPCSLICESYEFNQDIEYEREKRIRHHEHDIRYVPVTFKFNPNVWDGTSCSRKQHPKKGVCVGGKCLPIGVCKKIKLESERQGVPIVDKDCVECDDCESGFIQNSSESNSGDGLASSNEPISTIYSGGRNLQEVMESPQPLRASKDLGLSDIADKDKRQTQSDRAQDGHTNKSNERTNIKTGSQSDQIEKSEQIDYIFPPPISFRPNEEATRTEVIEKVSSNEDVRRSSFFWKKVPTDRCTRDCGGGHKMFIWNCIDEKYQVKVSEEVCTESGFSKPSEISDELCENKDCPPSWVFSEWKGDCQEEKLDEDACHLVREVRCSYRDKSGKNVTVDDINCSLPMKPEDMKLCPKCSKLSSNITNMSSSAPSDATDEIDKEKSFRGDRSSKTQTSDATRADSRRHSEVENNIINMMPPISSSSDLFAMNHGHHKYVPDSIQYNEQHSETELWDEPTFITGNWSACDAPCGEYEGKRRRDIACKMRLRASSTPIELPLIDCRATQAMPATEELCVSDKCIEPPSSDHQTNERNSTRQELEATKIVDSNDSHSSNVSSLNEDRFIWKSHGWTQCSVECLTGSRESIVVCWDPSLQLVVDSKLCINKDKPGTETELCNQGPCKPFWATGPFSNCSRPCGSGGIRKRDVVCRQQFTEEFEGLRVSNDLCNATGAIKPSTEEPCNLIDCKPDWSVSQWGPCLTEKSCGPGISRRNLTCEQEFATKQGPMESTAKLSKELEYGVSLSSNSSWHPGKVTKVPFEICFNEIRDVPMIDRNCYIECNHKLEAGQSAFQPYIESEPNQNYHMPSPRKKTVGLKLGGQATLYEGTTLKLQCKVIVNPPKNEADDYDDVINYSKANEQSRSTENGANNETYLISNRDDYQHLEWIKDGVTIFSNGTTTNDEALLKGHGGEKSLGNLVRLTTTARPRQQEPTKNTRCRVNNKGNLRIRRLQMDDSGVYTCNSRGAKESITIKVIPSDRHQYFIEGASALTREMLGDHSTELLRTRPSKKIGKSKRRTRQQQLIA